MNTELTKVQLRDLRDILETKVGQSEAESAREILTKRFERQKLTFYLRQMSSSFVCFRLNANA